ncbi:hypothetical protein VTK56DRAFT_4397 [Thermocarpiscus australiensis]
MVRKVSSLSRTLPLRFMEGKSLDQSRFRWTLEQNPASASKSNGDQISMPAACQMPMIPGVSLQLCAPDDGVELSTIQLALGRSSLGKREYMSKKSPHPDINLLSPKK